jgi:hypothetical protein
MKPTNKALFIVWPPIEITRKKLHIKYAKKRYTAKFIVVTQENRSFVDPVSKIGTTFPPVRSLLRFEFTIAPSPLYRNFQGAPSGGILVHSMKMVHLLLKVPPAGDGEMLANREGAPDY